MYEMFYKVAAGEMDFIVEEGVMETRELEHSWEVQNGCRLQELLSIAVRKGRLYRCSPGDPGATCQWE